MEQVVLIRTSDFTEDVTSESSTPLLDLSFRLQPNLNPDQERPVAMELPQDLGPRPQDRARQPGTGRRQDLAPLLGQGHRLAREPLDRAAPAPRIRHRRVAQNIHKPNSHP